MSKAGLVINNLSEVNDYVTGDRANDVVTMVIVQSCHQGDQGRWLPPQEAGEHSLCHELHLYSVFSWLSSCMSVYTFSSLQNIIHSCYDFFIKYCVLCRLKI